MSQLISSFVTPVKIYALQEPDFPHRTRYVGKTRKTLQKRLSQHLVEVNRRASPKNSWIKALRAHDKTPRISLLEFCEETEWQTLERAWIAFFKITSKDCLNVCEGGETGPVRVGWRHTSEALSKIAEAGRKMWLTRPKKRGAWGLGLKRGYVGWSKGIPKPLHVREALRKAQLGRRQSQDEKDKRAASLRGKRRTEAQKQNISEARIKNAPTRPVVCKETQVIYRNVRAASVALRIPPNSIHQGLKHKRRAYGLTFQFKEVPCN